MTAASEVIALRQDAVRAVDAASPADELAATQYTLDELRAAVEEVAR